MFRSGREKDFRERIDIFLSSRQKDERARDLREKIFSYAVEFGLSMWQPPAKALNTPADEILEECLHYLSISDIYVCILLDTYGTNQETLANLSILELEIFYAVLSEKTLYFFAVEPFKPSDELRTLLDALEIMAPDLIVRCQQEEVLRWIRKILRQHWLWFPKQLAELKTKLSQRLWERSEDSTKKDLSSVFLNGRFVPFAFGGEIDENLVNRLLEKAASTTNERTKLVFLWAAIRHLSMEPYDKIHDRVKLARILPLWNRALSDWAGAAAWTGFHGRHFTLGRLAVLNSMLKLQEYGSVHGVSVGGPLNGPIASECYSLAKQAGKQNRRYELLNKAREQLETGLGAQSKDPSGLLLIKGSVLLYLGRLKEAVLAYEAACAHRELAGANDGSRGEAYAEVGFAYLRQGRLVEAKRQLESGVALLKKSNRRAGFTVRAMKKLALCYLLNLHPLRAVHELHEACNLAFERSLNGQITVSMRVIYWVCKHLDRRKPDK